MMIRRSRDAHIDFKNAQQTGEWITYDKQGKVYKKIMMSKE